MVTVQKQIASVSSGGEAHSLKRSHFIRLIRRHSQRIRLAFRRTVELSHSCAFFEMA
jgi:hypothetical protein